MREEEGFIRELEFNNSEFANILFGPFGKNLELFRKKFKVEVHSSGAKLYIKSKDVKKINLFCDFLSQAYELIRRGHLLLENDLSCAIDIFLRDPKNNLLSFFKENLLVVTAKKTISPKSINQKRYLEAIKKKELVFGIGPAGTGKTYLGVAMGVYFLNQRKIKRIILTRPAIEAGEKIGFLPGDILEKVNPYLRPLYDALHDFLDYEKVKEMIDTGVIEVAPLAFMRGRTLNDAFIILDEAQNTTVDQMKMFLTRIGHRSKAVVTGDVTQIDLPKGVLSGLIHAQEVLKNIQDVEFVYFDEEDVMRNDLVAKIVKAYEEYEKKKFS